MCPDDDKIQYSFSCTIFIISAICLDTQNLQEISSVVKAVINFCQFINIVSQMRAFLALKFTDKVIGKPETFMKSSHISSKFNPSKHQTHL